MMFIMSDEITSSCMKSLSRRVLEASDPDVPHTYRSSSSCCDQSKPSSVLASNGVTERDVIYVTLPLYHTAGFIIRFKFSASQFWDGCQTHDVTVIQYIGEVLPYLCNTPEVTPKRELWAALFVSQRLVDKQHDVRLAIGNGLRADVWRKFLQGFGSIEVRDFYASTEGNVGFVSYAGGVGAIGRISCLHKVRNSKYDTEQDEALRDARGLCVEVPKGGRQRTFPPPRFQTSSVCWIWWRRCDVTDTLLVFRSGRMRGNGCGELDGLEFESTRMINHMCGFLPAYARPRLFRIRVKSISRDEYVHGGGDSMECLGSDAHD